MNRVPTVILRAAILAIGAIVLAICVFALPATWRAVAAEYPTHTYVFYIIILLLYLAAIPFYGALYQGMRLLRYIDSKQAFSQLSVTALKRISIFATIISGIFIVSLPFFYIWAQNDDAPGLILFALFLVCAPFVIGVFAAVLQRLLQEALHIKSENELTV